MKPAPLIGLTCWSHTRPNWSEHAPGLPVDFLFRDYPAGIREAGGLPVLLPTCEPEAAAEVLGRLDGLVLSGGPDVLPRIYDQPLHRKLGETDYERDLMEVALVQAAVDLKLPLLGVCRGCQIINAALGGTLFQDIASELKGAVNHEPSAGKHINTHVVYAEAGTQLYSLLGGEPVWVNSQHHQAAAETAPPLVVAARAEDGVVEAVEHPGHPFLIGVQWHPEGTRRSDSAALALFSALVEAAVS